MSGILKSLLGGGGEQGAVDASAAKKPWPGNAIDQRIDAHAERLWREGGQKGSPGDYRDKAREIVSREEMPGEMESTG